MGFSSAYLEQENLKRINPKKNNEVLAPPLTSIPQLTEVLIKILTAVGNKPLAVIDLSEIIYSTYPHICTTRRCINNALTAYKNVNIFERVDWGFYALKKDFYDNHALPHFEEALQNEIIISVNMTIDLIAQLFLKNSNTPMRGSQIYMSLRAEGHTVEKSTVCRILWKKWPDKIFENVGWGLYQLKKETLTRMGTF